MTKSSALAYVPAIHRGYVRFFQQSNCDFNYVLAQEVLGEFPDLRKELRALTPRQAVEGLRGVLGRSCFLQLAGYQELNRIAESGDRLILPDEDFMHELQERHFPELDVEFMPIFLRWDRTQVAKQSEVQAGRTISESEFDQEIMQLAYAKAMDSSNIWRKVGAALVQNGQVVLSASNRHQPTDQSPWMDGDPRNTLSRGVGMEVSTDLHAEALVVAEAARQGVALQGASLYVTTFPCPWCAKLLAPTGIRVCYFHEGYSVLDAAPILEAAGIELVQVAGDYGLDDADLRVPYAK
jgi:dCMP deaminase